MRTFPFLSEITITAETGSRFKQSPSYHRVIASFPPRIPSINSPPHSTQPLLPNSTNSIRLFSFTHLAPYHSELLHTRVASQSRHQHLTHCTVPFRDTKYLTATVVATTSSQEKFTTETTEHHHNGFRGSQRKLEPVQPHGA